MLALIFSVELALYLLGPDLLARWVLGFVVPRKALVQSRAEEVGRAVLWAAVPLLFAVLWFRASSGAAHNSVGMQFRTFFAGLYSDKSFERAPDAWFASAGVFAELNWCLLWRLYSVVLAGVGTLAFVTRRYGAIRRALPDGQLRALLATLTIPRVTEWHVLLSDMLLPQKNMKLYADVLTGSGLYRGSVQDKVLGDDGSLQSLTLGTPERFRRDDYQRAKAASDTVSRNEFWRGIPGNLFVVLGSDIQNVNLRYERLTPTTQQKLVLKKLIEEASAGRTRVHKFWHIGRGAA